MRLLPSNINDKYTGTKIAYYGLFPIFAVLIFRSLVHFLSESSGLVGIATIKQFPLIDGLNPNNLIYLFASLWGATQVSLTIILLVLFIKYKSFIPLIYLICLLDQCIASDGVQLFIGQESGYRPLGDMSLVTSTYQLNGELAGALGVIGPTRMDYKDVIPVVDVTARLLSAAMRRG